MVIVSVSNQQLVCMICHTKEPEARLSVVVGKILVIIESQFRSTTSLGYVAINASNLDSKLDRIHT